MAPQPTMTDLIAFNFNLDKTGAITAGHTLAGQTFMHDLARQGDVLSAEVVGAAGADIDAPDGEGRRPLHEAAAFGRGDMVRFLLEGGALIDAPIHPFGTTALMLAVAEGHEDIVRLLIARGARVDVRDRLTGQGLLHLAAARGDMRMAGILIAAGIDTLCEDARGQTARDIAARNRHFELERVLLKVMEHHVRR